MPTSSDHSIAIRFEEVTKYYRLHAGQSGLGSRLKRLAGRAVATPNDLFLALRDVSFEVPQGQTLGIIGPNGAGKSTILKLTSSITDPSLGRVAINGRLSSLIELGAGFHPDLTGRENVYLNGVILGLSRQQIRQRFDEIVDFSGIEEFIDVPVKRYSSGMHARLGFAVAAHVEPEILLVDEVLAVGDTAFQFRCLSKIRQLVDEVGCTVVFISHNMDTVQGLCERVMWLDHGVIQDDGSPERVIESYLIHEEKQQLGGSIREVAPGPLEIDAVTLRNSQHLATVEFASGDEVIVELHYVARQPVVRPIFSIGIRDPRSSLICLATMLIDGAVPVRLTGCGTVSCHFSGIALMPKAYQIWGSVRDAQGLVDLVPWQHLSSFRVTTTPHGLVTNGNPVSISHLKKDASIYVPYEWIIR